MTSLIVINASTSYSVEYNNDDDDDDDNEGKDVEWEEKKIHKLNKKISFHAHVYVER
jgi:hypothetical protein